MKRISILSLLIILFCSHLDAQCSINYKGLLDKYCNGVYLYHKELNNPSAKEIFFLFKKGNRYAIYLLNPSGQLPEFAPSGSVTKFKDVVTHINKQEKVMSYAFTAGEDGKYTFSYDFKTTGEACVLLAMYLQNISYKPGIYKKFDEFRYNNPSVALQGNIASRTDHAGPDKVTFYSLRMKRNQERELGKLFGFSDGSDIYVRRKEGIGIPSEFVKVDNFGKYGYFEDILYIPTSSASIPVLTMNLIDMNTGETERIDRKYLRDLLADEPGILEDFEREPQKSKKMKDYLIRYLEKKSGVPSR